MARPIETVCTHLALRQPYGANKRLNGVETQRRKTESAADFFHQPLVFRRIGGGILVEILVGIAFKLLYDAARDKLHVALRCREAHKGAAIDERWTCNAHVHLAP